MILRKLELKDAENMLNWMQDPTITRFFRFSSDSVDFESVCSFIKCAQDTSENLHLAIVNESDNYVGTISLKNIDMIAHNAEYAISTCSCIHGTGIAYDATREILKIAFDELDLYRVYLNVIEENKRAIHFYEKFGFVYEGQFRSHICINDEFRDLNWYSMLRGEFYRSYKSE